MKNYTKPEVTLVSLYTTPVANDPFDFSGGNSGNEVEISATDWWDLLE
jgi:hypothetical protein